MKKEALASLTKESKDVDEKIKCILKCHLESIKVVMWYFFNCMYSLHFMIKHFTFFIFWSFNRFKVIFHSDFLYINIPLCASHNQRAGPRTILTVRKVYIIQIYISYSRNSVLVGSRGIKYGSKLVRKRIFTSCDKNVTWAK